MSNGDDIDTTVSRALQDGVILNTALRNLSSQLNNEVEDERVLNGPLSMVCTYPEGYKERQALFSCLTCQHETGEMAGICFACSENCHQDHEIIQLHTKRNFCCDCGNSKFKTKCQLFEEKSAVNRKNAYNHNFTDKYCACKKPYPPPEDDPIYDEEMFQCSMCEDWFHAIHIGLKEIQSENFSELVCPDCSTKFPFIFPYYYVYEQENAQQEESVPDETTCNSEPAASVTDNPPSSSDNPPSSSVKPSEASTPIPSTTGVLKPMEPSTPCRAATVAKPPEPITTPRRPPVDNTAAAEDLNDCYYEKIKSIVPPESTTPRALVFYDFDWRPMLCRCVKCKKMYEDRECEYLLDENDPVYRYLIQNATELEKTKRDPQTELFDEVALRTNADVAHIMVTEVATFKHELGSFLKRLSDEKQEVTEKDVHDFFGELTAKRRRLDETGDGEKDA